MLQIILLSFLGVIGSAIVARSQDSLLLHATRDAVVVYHDGYPSGLRNYGSTDTYSAVCQPGAIWGVNSSRTLFQFDFSDVPAGANIIRAELNLFGRCCVRDAGLVSSYGNTGNNTTFIERVITPWEESLITWETKPQVTTENQVMLESSVEIYQDYLNIDVLPLVSDMLIDPANSFGFSLRLVSEEPVRGIFFCSREHADSTKHPVLRIIYEQTNAVQKSEIPKLICRTAPNPFSNKAVLYIATEQPVYGKIILSDLQGRVVKSFAVNGVNQIGLNRDELPAGLYFFKLISNSHNDLANGKLIVN